MVVICHLEAPKKQPVAAASHNIFGGGESQASKPQSQSNSRHGNSSNIFGGASSEAVGPRSRNRQPPGGASHNIFG